MLLSYDSTGRSNPVLFGGDGKEYSMTLNTFRKPLRMLVGLGFPRDIHSPLEALAYLNEAPASFRSGAYKMALKACQAALSGEIEAETARGTFEAYARKHDLLAPDISDIIAVSAAGRHDPRPT